MRARTEANSAISHRHLHRCSRHSAAGGDAGCDVANGPSGSGDKAMDRESSLAALVGLGDGMFSLNAVELGGETASMGSVGGVALSVSP